MKFLAWNKFVSENHLFAAQHSSIPALQCSRIHEDGEKSSLLRKDSKTMAFCRTYEKIGCHFFLPFALTFSICGDNETRLDLIY